MNATMAIDGKVFPLGGATLDLIFIELLEINGAQSQQQVGALLVSLADHSDPAIRSMVCGAECVPLDALRRLAEDQDISVIQSLIEDSNRWGLLRAEDRQALGLDNSTQVLSFIGEDTVRRWLSWPCLQLHVAIAENIGKFSAKCECLIADTLVQHPSFRVREVLAGNGSLAGDYHEILAGDEDPGIRAIVARTLVELAEAADSWDNDDNEDDDEG